jgi:hypothetical protein
MRSRTTDPLTKFFRTGEGILVFGFNIALLVVPIVSNALTPDQSAKWAAVIDGVTVISRTGLKAVAAGTSSLGARQTAQAAEPQSAIAASPTTPTIEEATGMIAAALPEFASIATQLPATLSADIADVESLVSDTEEFASSPSAVHSRPALQGAASSSMPRNYPHGHSGSAGASTRPFRVRIGDGGGR